MSRRYRITWLTPLLTLLPVCLGLAADNARASTQDQLQQLIDRAQPGSTLIVPSGTYAGPATFNKPLHVIAETPVRIVNDTDEPAISILADQVRLDGLLIEQNGRGEQSAAVLVASDRNVLTGLDIRTRGDGILLREANGNELKSNQIVWLAGDATGPTKLTDKGNGIDLYGSHSNRIVGNTVSGVFDGIYLESSDDNAVSNNRIVDSRYGIHLMYVERAEITGNSGENNVTGAMIMEVSDTTVENNRFDKQNQNVNSQGLLMFSVRDTSIRRNALDGNRVGMYVETSQNNELTDNELQRNFIGVQLRESSGNRFERNRFVSNVIPAEAIGSSDNDFDGNYWDDFQGIDLTGSGVSSLPYRVNPLFLSLTKDQPAFQLFFRSPGMDLMESLFTESRGKWTADHSPLTGGGFNRPAADDSERPIFTLLFSIVLLALSMMSIFIWGVRRQ